MLQGLSRDRGGGYGAAIAKALPDADQVADRWHVMEHSSRAFLDAVCKSMCQIKQAVGSNVVDLTLLTHAQRLQYEGHLRRQETNEAIWELKKKGTSSRQIVRQTGPAASWFARFCVASVLMCSEQSQAYWIAGYRGSTADGTKELETSRHFGVR